LNCINTIIEMKKYITLSVLFLSTFFYAQTSGISYQAVIYNPNPEVLPGYNQANSPLVNKKVCLKFSIVDVTSAVEYQETIETTTDEFGMVNLTIGTGTPIGGYAALFEDIIWDSTTKRLQVELDPSEKCTNFLEISNQPFTAVPFAFASKTAENVTGIVAIANGGTGANTIAGARTNLGLNNVDNTSDLNKPISTAMQTALNLKENTANKSDNINLGTSSVLFPTQNAVKIYVDNKINTSGADLAIEVVRATNAENTLTTNLNAEIARATASENTKEDKVNKSTDVTLADTSNTKFPTELAVKTYVDNQITMATPDASTLNKGKIKLAGDLTGTADLPLVQNDAITSAKIANATIINEDIANATITTAKIDGAISVVNGGTGADLSTSLGYIKHAATGANFTTVSPIPATDVFGAVRFVNGSPADTTTGNVAVPFGYVTTGFLTNRPAISTTNNGDIFVISGETGANASDNGRTFISTGAAGNWNEVTSNQASTDARYVQLSGSTMLGSLAFPTGTKITVVDAPTSSSDLTNKTYVDDRITIVNNALTAEVTRATAAENTKEDKVNKSADVTLADTSNTKFPTELAVKTYVDGKSATLATDLQTEITNRTAADTVINTALTAEVTRATAAETNLTTNLAAEVTRATAAENTKEDKVNKSTDVTLADTSNTKFPTELAVKTYVDGKSATLATDLQTEITNRTAADTTINTALTTEITRATAAEALKQDISNKSTDGTFASSNVNDTKYPTTQAVKTYVDANASAATTALNNEITRATGVESTLTTNLAAEVTRATDAEALKQDISNKSTDGTFASSNVNDIKYPTTQAVKTYVDNQVTAATPNASNTVLGKIQLAGDLAGSNDATNPIISNSAITTIKIADANVTNAKLEANAITTDKIKDGEVQTADIKDANVTTTKIADANVTNAKLSDDAVTTDKILDGTIVVADLANDAVETSKIKDSNVTTAKIADANVTTAKIEHGAADQVLKTNTAGTGVEWGKLSAANIVGKDLTAADASITVVNGAGATLIDANLKVTDLGITTAKLAASAVTTDKITDANVTEAKLAANAVTSAKIVDGTIATADLGDNSVGTNKIIDASVTTTKIADANVTNAKLADNAVTSAKITNGTIINEDIADATITTAKISGTIAIAQGGTGATTAVGALTNLGAEAVANKATATDMGGTNADDVKYPTQLAVKTFVANVANSLNSSVGTATQTALNLKEDESNKSTDVALGTSNQLYPSQNAVKSYVDTKLTTANAIASLTYLPNIATNRILGNTTGASTTPQEIPVTGTGDVVLKTSAEINTPTITSPVLNGTISGTAIVPVAQGGSGADMSTTAGYVKQATTGANFTTVPTIPVAHVTGAVRKVNGIEPNTDGNVAVIIGRVFTGAALNPNDSPSITGAIPSLQSSDIYIIADGSNPNNGRTFIYDGTNWLEVATDLSTTDTRYVNVAGDVMEGNLTFPTGNKIILADAPSGSTDAVNKAYVDGLVSSATPDATLAATGKIQLTGDLTGTATAPEIGANKVTFPKMQTVAEGVVLGRSSTGTGNIEALTTLPEATLPALTGDITTNAGSAATTISDNAVTLAKIQNLSAQSKLLGTPSTGGLGVAEISLGTGLSMSGGTLSATGGTVTNLTGTTDRITVTNGATTPTIDIALTYAGQSSITTLGTITTGTWNGTTISVPNGGTGATTLTGYVIGNGTSAMTASTTIPVADVTGAQTVANKSTDGTFASSNDTNYPSQLAVQTYVNTKVAAATPDATTSATGKIQLAGDLTGTATAPVVGTGKITSDKILDATIATADIAASAITSTLIADGTIITADLGAASVTNAKIGETITVANGGTGATTLTGYVKGTGTTAMTASATIPVADVTGAQTTANISSSITTNTGSTTMYPSVAAVETALALKAPLGSPALTGVPTAPTAAAGTNTTQIATTAFVTAASGTPFYKTATTTDILSDKTSNFYTNKNMGIGTNSPTTNLDVVGGFNLRNTAGAAGTGYGIEFNTNASSPRIDWVYNGNYTGSFAGDSDFFFRLQNSKLGAGGFRFLTNPSGTGLERFTILNNGNIGVGIANPTKLFHLYTANTASLLFESADSAGGQASIDFKVGNNSSYWRFIGQGTSNGSRFDIYNQKANSMVLSILSTNNNVGIGTLTPAERLTVSGNILADKLIKTGGTSAQFLKADGSVDTIAYAPLVSPTFTGTPAAPTATAGTSTTQIATTAFVTTAVAAATIADADATTKGKIQLAGDLGGTAAVPLVAKLQGTAVSATAPTTNQLLQYDGTSWKPVSKSAIVTMETEEFTPTASQTSFSLTNTPIGKVAMFINGVRVPKAAVSVSGTTVTYAPASNAAYAVLVTDRVSFDYIY
jgi:hypothetical protein